MTTSIDERIVRMEFDNSKFESNIKDTISSLDKLDKSLKMDGAADSLNSVSEALRETSSNNSALNSMADNVNTISSRFTNLGVIATTALMSITNYALSAGASLVSSLMLDPIRQGFEEYELKMGSVMTILNSGRTADGLPVTLDMVNDKLDELNTYADRTIYSFSDMTNNIGKFTNAGVNLDMSVAAIQGISNAAALAGANSQQASHAMYNFAQALSSGYVKLIDWKSIENANMATVEFKDELIKTALEVGTLTQTVDGYYESLTTNAQGKVSDAFDATHGFNDALQSQWMTTEVLTKTLARYADETTEVGRRAFAAAQEIKTWSQLMDTLKESVGSSWAQTFELIFGNFTEAKKLWTTIDQIVEPFISLMGDVRNALVKDFMVPFRQALSEIVPSTLTDMLSDFGKSVQKLGEAFVLSDEGMSYMVSILKSLISPLEIVAEIIGAVINNVIKLATVVVSKLGAAVTFILGGISKVTDRLNEFFDIIRLLVRSASGMNVADLFGLGDVVNAEGQIESLRERFISFGEALTLVFKSGGLLYEMLNNISPIFGKLYNLIGDRLVGAVTELSNGFNNVGNKIQSTISKLEVYFSRFISSVRHGLDQERYMVDGTYTLTNTIVYNMVKNFKALYDGIDNLLYALSYGFTKTVIDLNKIPKAMLPLYNAALQLSGALDRLWNSIKGLFSAIGTALKPAIDAVRGFFESLGLSLSVEKDFLDVSDGITGAFEKLSDAITFVLDIITKGINIVKEFIDNLTAMVNLDIGGFSGIVAGAVNAIGQAFEFLKNILMGAAGVIGIAFGGIVTIFASLKDVVVNVVTALSSFAEPIYNGFNKVSVAMNEMSGPMQIVYNAASRLRDAFTTLGNAIKTVFDKIASRFKPLTDAISELGNIGTELTSLGGNFEHFGGILSSISGVLNIAVSAFRTFANAFLSLFGITSSASDSFNEFGESIQAAAGPLSNFADDVSGIIDVIGNGLGGLIDAISFVIERFSDLITHFKVGDLIADNPILKFINTLQSQTKPLLEAIRNYELAATDLPGYLSKIMLAFKSFNPFSAAQATAEWGLAIANNIKASIEAFPWQEIGQTVMDYVTGALASMSEISRWIVDFFSAIPWSEITGTLIDGFGILIQNAADIAGQVVNVVIDTITGLFTGGSKQIADGMEQTATQALDQAGNAISDVAKGKATDIIGAFLSIFTENAYADELSNGITDNVNGAIDSAGDEAKTIFERFGEILRNVLVNVFGGLVNFVASTLRGFRNAIVTELSNLFPQGMGKTIGADIKGILDEITSGFKEIFSGIKMSDIMLLGNTIASFITAISTYNLSKGFNNLTGKDSGLMKFLGSLSDSMPSKMIGNLKELKEGLNTFTAEIKVPLLLQIAGAVTALAVSIYLLSSIDASKVDDTLRLLAYSMISMAIALGIVVAALKSLKAVDLAGMDLATGAVGLMAIAAAFLVMAGAMKILSTIDISSLPSMIVNLVLMTAAMAAMVAVLSTAKGPMMQGAASLLVLAVAMVAMAGALTLLSIIPMDRLITGFGELMVGLMGLLGVITLFSLASKELVGTKLAMMELAGSLLVLAAALTVFAIAMKIITSIPFDSLASTMIILGVAIAALGHGVNLLVSKSASIFTLSVSFGIFAAAILGLAVALRLLSGIPIESLAVSMGVVALAIGAFVVAANMLRPCIVVIELSSLAIATIAASMLMAAQAFAIFTAAAIALGAAGPIVGAGINMMLMEIINVIPMGLAAIAEGLVLMGEILGPALMGLISQIGSFLLESIPQIVAYFGEMFTSALTELGNILPTIVPILGEFIVNLFSNLQSIVPEVIGAIGDFLLTVFVAAIQGIAMALGPIFEVLSEIFTGIGDLFIRLAEIIAPYSADIANAIVTIVQVVTDAIVTITGILAPFLPNIESIINRVCELLEHMADVIPQVFQGATDVITAFGESVTGILEGIAGIFDSIGQAALNAGDGFLRLAEGVKMITELNLADVGLSMAAVAACLADIGAQSANLYTAGEGMQMVANSAVISEAAFMGMTASIAIVTAGLAGIGEVASGAMAVLSAAVASAAESFSILVSAASETTAQILAAFSELSALGALLTSIASESMAAFVAALMAGATVVQTAIRSIIESVVNAAKSYYGQFSQAGSYLGQGLVAGIRAKESEAYQAGLALGRKSAQGVKDGADEHSPSKLTRQYGIWLGEGLIQGMDTMSKAVYLAGEDMGSTAGNAVTSALDVISNVSDDYNYSPTLTPVIDLSSTRATASDISGLFDIQRLNFNSAVDASFLGSTGDTIAMSIQQLQNATVDSNNKLWGAIKDIRETIDDHYSNTQTEVAMYVDSKKLASSLARPMNQQLGVLSRRGAI